MKCLGKYFQIRRSCNGNGNHNPNSKRAQIAAKVAIISHAIACCNCHIFIFHFSRASRTRWLFVPSITRSHGYRIKVFLRLIYAFRCLLIGFFTAIVTDKVLITYKLFEISNINILFQVCIIRIRNRSSMFLSYHS